LRVKPPQQEQEPEQEPAPEPEAGRSGIGSDPWEPGPSPEQSGRSRWNLAEAPPRMEEPRARDPQLGRVGVAHGRLTPAVDHHPPERRIGGAAARVFTRRLEGRLGDIPRATAGVGDPRRFWLRP